MIKVCFLVGSMAISGGTYVIVQHASYLKNNGYDVTLAVQEPFDESTLSWHDEAKGLNCIDIQSAKGISYDLVIATWWKTAFELSEFDSKKYAYFVQSIESKFYPDEEQPLRQLVDRTYTMPVNYITEATWIKEYLEQKFGHSVSLVKNGIRKDIYSCRDVAETNREPRVLIEGPFGVSFKNTALAVKLARKAGAKDIWLLTGSPVSWIPGISKVFSRVPMFETPEIYRSCDILIKLSTVEGMFGPPLEMFHCGGTAIVFDVTGHDEYIIDGQNAVVIRTGDTNQAVNQIRELLRNPSKLHRLKEGAKSAADLWPDWSESSGQFAAWVEKCMHGTDTDRNCLGSITTQAYEEYANLENSRLETEKWVRRKQQFLGQINRLPSPVKDGIRKLNAILEVLSPSNKVS